MDGITPLHGQLHERALQWSEEIRAVAAMLGDVWIEKVVIKSRKRDASTKNFTDESPLRALLKAVESSQFEESSLVSLLPEFEKLRSKLPSDLLADGDPFRPDADDLSALREEVKELLTGKMERGAS